MSYVVADYNCFSPRHGGGVTLSENATVATATRVDDAMAYTALPVPVGRLFQLKCLKPGIIVSIYNYCSQFVCLSLMQWVSIAQLMHCSCLHNIMAQFS